MESIIPVYKIHELHETGTKHIYVMGEFEATTMDTLWNNDPNNIVFDTLLGKEDKQMFQQYSVSFINIPIHLDDKIGTIKLKIAKALHLKYSTDEIYLYGLVKEKLNPNHIYQILTQNGNLSLTKLRFSQFLFNIKNESNTTLPFDVEDKEKEVYSFDDILKLNLTSKDYLVAKPLGQKLLFSKEYPFIVNPFQVKEFDSFLENSRKETTTLNNELLLSTNYLVNNTIYLCLAPAVFTYMEQLKLLHNYTSKIYYPFLHNEHIDTLKKLDKEKKKLIKQTKEQLSTSTLQSFKIIDDLYKISGLSKPSTDFKKLNTGIKNFTIELVPPFKMNLPIETLFKMINSDNVFPLIKYNPSIKKENIYRLYSNNISTKGQRIPMLNKALIFKLIKAIGKESTISFYTEVLFNNISIPIIIEISNNAFISVYNFQEFDFYLKLEDLDGLVSKAINPLIDKIKPLLQQGGYDLKYYNTLYDNNIDVKNITFNIKYHITKVLNFSTISTCFKTIFITESDNLKEGMKLRYKRVSYFNEYDSQQAFIIEKQNQDVPIEKIIEQLTENFPNVSKDHATDIVLKIVNEEQIIRGSFRNRAITIKQNPGFRTLVTYNSINNECEFSVDSINNIQYIPLITTYIDSLVHINQDIKSTGLNSSTLQKLCSSTKAEEITFQDIIATSEDSLFQNELPRIVNETIVYPEVSAVPDVQQEDNNNMDELLDVLGFNDFDEYEEVGQEDIVGGAKEDESSTSFAESSSDSSSTSLAESNQSSSTPLAESTQLSIAESLPEKGEEIVLEENSQSSTPLAESSQSSNKKEIILEESSQSKSEKSSTPLTESSPDKGEEIILEESSQSKSEQSSTPLAESTQLSIAESLPEKKEEIVLEEKSQPLSESSSSEKEIVIEEIVPEAKPEKSTKEIPLNNETIKKSVDGLKLSNPYYFQEILEKKDPGIFLSLRDGKFDGYSRMCPSATRRQPVILSKEELEEMAKEKNNGLMGTFTDGEYTGPDAIKYGSSSANAHYYMCPKYWCLLTNKPLTQKQVDNGECGGKNAIVPKGERSVPKGKSIYEFYEDDKGRFPGFHKEVTPNGLCIPCCYESWNKPSQTKRRQQCQMDKSEVIITRETEKDEYIKGPEKFPLAEGRWGFLPVQVEKFFQEINKDCKTTKFTIATNTTCVLRLGVENNENQSFIACVATLLFYGVNDPRAQRPKIQTYFPNYKGMVPSIVQMKELIVRSLKLDKFATYQNGDLVTIFYKEGPQRDYSSFTDENITSSQLVKLAKTDKEKEFVSKCVNSFDNFKNYLQNNEVLIDYTYLWDMISEPNETLFNDGINLVILEIMNHDNTNNIELICPSNHYSNHLFNPNKRSVIIIKQGNYYEPILSYRNVEKRIEVTQTFQQNDKELPASLKTIFTNVLDPILNLKCKAFPSKMKEYKFKEAIKVPELMQLLKEKELNVKSQVVNFQGKVIGFKVEHNNKEMNGVIPCFPSSVLPKITIEYMDEVEWSNYETTFALLEYFFEKDKKNIMQVIEEKVVVGFLTPTNQFIQINPPLPENQAKTFLSKVNENNYLVADINTQLSLEKDKERVDFIKRITLENKFYNSFRNTIKIELNHYENLAIREELETICNNTLTLYNVKLTLTTDLIKKLLDKKVVFVNKRGGFNIDEVNDIYTCIIIPTNKCNDNKPVCMFKDGTCNLIIPKKNLVTNTNNEEYYFGKIADELIRFNRIKSFILNPQTFISFGKKDYNLKENEILILQSLITQSYFENKIPMELNEYAKYNSYDTAYPQQAVPIDNVFTLDPSQSYKTTQIQPEIVEKKEFSDGRLVEDFEKQCKNKKTKIISKKWKKCFPDSYNQLYYEGSIACTFKIIKDILFEVKHMNVSMIELKRILIQCYKDILLKNKDKVKNIESRLLQTLLSEGKKVSSNKEDYQVYLEEFILQDDYWISNLDLWILLIHYKINSMFISPFAMKESSTNKNNAEEVVVYNSNENDYFVFIILPSQKIGKDKAIDIPNFNVVINEKNNKSINRKDINMECFPNLEIVENDSNLVHYLGTFKLPKKIEFEIEGETPVKRSETKQSKNKKLKKTMQEFEIDE